MPLGRFLLVLVIAGWSASAAPRPVILTTDCGADMDDQWALAHLALSPEFDVRAVVTTHTGKFPILAPPAGETSARIAREVLAHIPARVRPDVIPGSSVPLQTRAPLPNNGVERIISESRKYGAKDRLTVIVIGAATDTASALLLDPTIADRVEVVAMAFNGKTGGDTFNVLNDPIAWKVILDSRIPVTVGDSTVTKRDLSMTSEKAHALLDAAGAPGRYLAGLLDQWLATHREIVVAITGDMKRWPVWDEVTVAYLLNMTRSEHRPRPGLMPDLQFEFAPTKGFINWVSAIDADRLWADFARRLQPAR